MNIVFVIFYKMNISFDGNLGCFAFFLLGKIPQW